MQGLASQPIVFSPTMLFQSHLKISLQQSFKLPVFL